MVHQKLIFIYHFPSSVEHFPTRSKHLAGFRKDSFLLLDDYFFSKSRLFGIIHLHCQKLKSQKILKYNPPVKTTQIFGAWTSQNCNF